MHHWVLFQCTSYTVKPYPILVLPTVNNSGILVLEMFVIIRNNAHHSVDRLLLYRFKLLNNSETVTATYSSIFLALYLYWEDWSSWELKRSFLKLRFYGWKECRNRQMCLLRNFFCHEVPLQKTNKLRGYLQKYFATYNLWTMKNNNMSTQEMLQITKLIPSWEMLNTASIVQGALRGKWL